MLSRRVFSSSNNSQEEDAEQLMPAEVERKSIILSEVEFIPVSSSLSIVQQSISIYNLEAPIILNSSLTKCNNRIHINSQYIKLP
jgi:hypothetical protein